MSGPSLAEILSDLRGRKSSRDYDEYLAWWKELIAASGTARQRYLLQSMLDDALAESEKLT